VISAQGEPQAGFRLRAASTVAVLTSPPARSSDPSPSTASWIEANGARCGGRGRLSSFEARRALAENRCHDLGEVVGVGEHLLMGTKYRDNRLTAASQDKPRCQPAEAGPTFTEGSARNFSTSSTNRPGASI